MEWVTGLLLLGLGLGGEARSATPVLSDLSYTVTFDSARHRQTVR